MTPTLPAAVPEIPVSDIAAATAYYRDRLGFVVDWGGEDLGLAGISKGGCRIFLADPTYRKRHGNAGVAMTWLNLQSKEEVHELHRAWTAAGARLMSAPESQPWGLHEFVAADPDGNLLR